jgi:hypothetical protein
MVRELSVRILRSEQQAEVVGQESRVLMVLNNGLRICEEKEN